MFAVLRQCFVLFAVLVLSGCLPSASDADPDKRADAAIELQSFAGGFANASVAAASQTVNNPKWAKGKVAEGALDSVALSGMNGQKMSNAFCHERDADGEPTGKGYFVSWLSSTTGALNDSVSSGTVLAGLSKVLPQDQIGHGNGRTVKYLNGARLSLSGCTGLDIPANAPVIVNAVKAVPEAAPVVEAQNENGDPQFVGARTTLDCGEGYTGEVVKESRLVPGSISQYEWIKVVDTCALKKQEIDTVAYLNDCGVVRKNVVDQAANPSLGYRNNVRVNNVYEVNAGSKKIWDVSGCEKTIDVAEEVKASTAVVSYQLPQEEMIVGCASSPPAGSASIGQFSGNFTSSLWSGQLKMVRDVTAYGTEAELRNDQNLYNNRNNRGNGNNRNAQLQSDVLYGAWQKHSATCNSTQELIITCNSVRPYMAEYTTEKSTNFRYTRNLRAVGSLANNVFGFAPTTYSTWDLQTDSTGCQWKEIERDYRVSCSPGFEATQGHRERTVTANGSVSRGDYTYSNWNEITPSTCVPIPVATSGRTVTSNGRSYRVECRNGHNGDQATYTSTANVNLSMSGNYLDAHIYNNISARQGYIRMDITRNGDGSLSFSNLRAQPGYHSNLCFQPQNWSDPCSTSTPGDIAGVNCSSELFCRVLDDTTNTFVYDNFSMWSQSARNCPSLANNAPYTYKPPWGGPRF